MTKKNVNKDVRKNGEDAATCWVFDDNMVKLFRVLNSFEGVKPFEGCGGHAEPSEVQTEQVSWYVNFKVAQNNDGWFALEFLTWFTNGKLFSEGVEVWVSPVALAHFYVPGNSLIFTIESDEIDAGWVAEELKQAKEDFFASPKNLEYYNLAYGDAVA